MHADLPPIAIYEPAAPSYVRTRSGLLIPDRVLEGGIPQITPVMMGFANRPSPAKLISSVADGDSVSRVTYTFSVRAAAGLKDCVLVVGFSGRDTVAIAAPTSVTWNGAAPLQSQWNGVGSVSYSGIGFYTWRIPAGSDVTANLVVTLTRAPNRGVYFADVLEVQSLAWRDIQFSNADPGVATITTAADGIVIGYCIGGQAATTFTWSIGTEDFDALGASAVNHSGMHLATTGAPATVTCTRSAAPTGSSGVMGLLAFR